MSNEEYVKEFKKFLTEKSLYIKYRLCYKKLNFIHTKISLRHFLRESTPELFLIHAFGWRSATKYSGIKDAEWRDVHNAWIKKVSEISS